MHPPDPDLAVVLARVAREISATRSLEATLDAIVRAARVSIPGFDEVGISVTHRDGRIETKAATGDLVWQMDALQHELGEGPGHHAVRAEPVVVAGDLDADLRWPRYAPVAVSAGVRAQVGLRLYTDETLGVLNLYSTATVLSERDAPVAAELFATHAAVALGHARVELQLTRALDSRKVIGQAIGLVMERYTLDHDSALQFLMRASSTGNRKLRDVAQGIVDQADKQYAGPAEESLAP